MTRPMHDNGGRPRPQPAPASDGREQRSIKAMKLKPFYDLSPAAKSNQMLLRFGLRMIILVAFAAFSGVGFGRSFAALLWMSTLLSAVVGAVRREPLFAGVLNYWDETVAYAALFALVTSLNQIVL
jgi:hypothetical protein